jgi:hypothetical protein
MIVNGERLDNQFSRAIVVYAQNKSFFEGVNIMFHRVNRHCASATSMIVLSVAAVLWISQFFIAGQAMSDPVMSLSEDSRNTGGVVTTCPLYQLDFDLDLNNWFDVGGFIKGPNSSPACLTDKFDEVTKWCKQHITDWYVIDDCIAISLVSNEKVRQCYRDWEFFNVKAAIWEPAQTVMVNADLCGKIYGQATVFLDDQCKSITDPAQADFTKACDVGTYQWLYSPISLLWDNGADIEQNVTVTTFPLEPGKGSRWYLWKASAQTPLLVYDPGHTGKVTSAFQLFGPWAFGGKQLASLNGGKVSGYPWANGYEALATLDKNGDGKIAGDELAPLALWFDGDRDGSAQEGEVKPLDRAGVTGLYYQPDRENTATKSLFASKGYERISDGKLVNGASVDWYADGADSQFELISKLFAQAEPKGGVSGAARNTVTDQASGEKETAAKPAHQPASEPDDSRKVNGAWLWSLDKKQVRGPGQNKEKEVPQGYLTLSDKGDGTITGHSYVELPFNEDAKTEVKRMVAMTTLKGTKQTDNDGRVTLKFSLTTKEGTQIDSEAELSRNGVRLINGKSVATTNYQGKRGSISYTWTAKRG